MKSVRLARTASHCPVTKKNRKLPQAMRIALPPTLNQYLNLVKNTSLGTAVGYAEITALTKTSVGNGRPAFQSFIIVMGVYLVFSLTISLVLNIVNRRMQLVSR